MLYLVSDIHGNLKDFLRMLKKIKWDRTNDKMIIVGDVLDRGPDGIKILNYIKPYIEDGSMTFLIGNHELFCVMYLNGELSELRWDIYGGTETINEIKKMSDEEKTELRLFLEGLSYYSVIQSKYFGRTVVTHTGIDCENYVYNSDGTINVTGSIEKAFCSSNRLSYMNGRDIHYIPESDRRKFDSYLILGHVPTFTLNEDISNKFYRTKTYMVIDSGCGYKDQGGTLGCYCVDTNEEIYL